MEVVIVVVLLGVIVWAFVRRPWRRARGRAGSATLERKYRRMLHLPEGAADETVARQMAALAERHPGKSRAWMLRKLIADLERARR